MSLAATDPGTPRPPLGVGRILKETVSLVWAWKGSVAVLGFLPLLALNLTRYALVPDEFTGGSTDDTATSYALNTLAFVIIFPVYSVVGGLITKQAYAVATQGDASVRDCFRSTMPILLPLVICDSAATLAYSIGLFAFLVPGLYLLTLWFVLVPCIVLEDAQYRCFERSIYLTRGYRWPCLAIATAFVAVDFGAEYLSRLLLDPFIVSDRLVDKAIYFVSYSAVSLIALALFATASTLVYLRLRDIKEGTVWLADVFD